MKTLDLTSEELVVLRLALSYRTIQLHSLELAYERVGLTPNDLYREANIVSDIQTKLVNI